MQLKLTDESDARWELKMIYPLDSHTWNAACTILQHADSPI